MQQDDERMGVPFQASGQADLKRWLAWWDPAHAALSQGRCFGMPECIGNPTNGKGWFKRISGVFQGDGNPCPSKITTWPALNLDAEYHNQQLHVRELPLGGAPTPIEVEVWGGMG